MAYVRLVRLPNLFTAPPDVLLGLALAVGLGHAVSITTAAGLSLASVLLYAAGTTLNDYFDADEDARLRPERPIPAGDVPRPRALVLGVGLLVAAVALATVAAGPWAGAVAAALAAAVFLYDAVAKGSVIGFCFMGASRGLNVLLGVTAAVVPAAVPARTLAVPLLVGVYIAAITFMAESESGDRARLAVPVGTAGVAVAAIGSLALLVARSPPAVEAAVAVVLLAGFVGWTGRALRRAADDPARIGPAIGTCVLALVVLDAALAAPSGLPWAGAVAGFLLPAVALSRRFDVS